MKSTLEEAFASFYGDVKILVKDEEERPPDLRIGELIMERGRIWFGLTEEEFDNLKEKARLELKSSRAQVPEEVEILN